jgi:hypothetical protein
VCLLLMASTGYSWDEGTGTGTVTVVDALDSTSATSALSANQGKVLNDGKAPAAGSTSLITTGPPPIIAVNCTDSGTSPAKGALTLTVPDARGIVNWAVTNLDADGCDITISETGATAGQQLKIFNVSAANTITFTTVADQQVLVYGSPKTFAATESIQFFYTGSLWRHNGETSATFGMTINDGAAQFASATASKGTMKVLLSGSTNATLTTLVFAQTDNRTVTMPDATATLATTADLTAGSLDWVTTGTISGRLKTVVYSADGTLNVTTAQAQAGTFFINTYAGTQLMTLPAAGAGMAVCLKNGQGNARALQVHSDATDYIVMSTGARTSASTDYYQAAAASATNQICLVAFDDTDWHVTSERGTWAEE